MQFGDYLESERTLSEKYKLSRTTVRLALQELEKLGYITIIHGKGSMVTYSKSKKIDLLKMEEFNEYFQPEKSNANKNCVSIKFTKNEQNILPDESLVKVINIVHIDNNPVAIEEIYIGADDLKAVDEYKKKLIGLQKDTSFRLDEYSATNISGEEAYYLKIEPNDAVINLLRKVYNKNNELSYYIFCKFRSDQFHIKQINLKSNA